MKLLQFAQSKVSRTNVLRVVATDRRPLKAILPSYIIDQIRKKEEERRKGPQPLHDEIRDIDQPPRRSNRDDDDRGSIIIIPGDDVNIIKTVYRFSCSSIRANDEVEIVPPSRRIPPKPLPVDPKYEIPDQGSPNQDPLTWRKSPKDPKHEIN